MVSLNFIVVKINIDKGRNYFRIDVFGSVIFFISLMWFKYKRFSIKKLISMIWMMVKVVLYGVKVLRIVIYVIVMIKKNNIFFW